jgi:UDP-N-acetylmuramoyl-L-alanyl-D-glutamate--2,6-diaminopimelate ligase
VNALQRIIQSLEQAGLVAESPDSVPAAIAGLTEDSRRVEPGWVFCAIEGTADDGHKYLADAVSRGAVAALVSRRSDSPLPQIVVRDPRAALALAAREWFGHPAREMEVVGVTGTNGKSTTVALIRHMVNRAGDAGSIGTLGAFDGAGEAVYQEGLTTPGPVQLEETLARLRDRGVRRLVMEVSSHALQQRRVDGVTFGVGVFTNLTHDHLDYHATLEEYFQAKQRLVKLVGEGGTVVINADEPVWSRLDVGPGLRTVSFGLREDAMVRAGDVEVEPDGTRFRLDLAGDTFAVRSPLLGGFNVSNALAAAAAAWCLDTSPTDIVARLADAPQVAGRMERIWAEGFLILRDYAHTPDALRRAIAAARPLTTGRLIVLFGCGGDRDRRKRPAMGKIAAADADLAIVTSDNPRTEDPDRIIDEIVEGMEGRAFIRITNRRDAIGRAVDTLEDGDCLLLAGKGHETYQVVGTERSPFDERGIVLDILGKRAAS